MGIWIFSSNRAFGVIRTVEVRILTRKICLFVELHSQTVFLKEGNWTIFSHG